MLLRHDALSSLEPAFEYPLDLIGSQAVDERVDHWRKKTVEDGGGCTHVGGHYQVGK